MLIQDLARLATVESVDGLRTEEERREELIRRTFRALELRLPGESAQEAEDRLTQVDSVERRRLLREAAEKEKRAREVRDMMARRAAEKAAAKVERGELVINCADKLGGPFNMPIILRATLMHNGEPLIAEVKLNVQPQ